KKLKELIVKLTNIKSLFEIFSYESRELIENTEKLCKLLEEIPKNMNDPEDKNNIENVAKICGMIEYLLDYWSVDKNLLHRSLKLQHLRALLHIKVVNLNKPLIKINELLTKLDSNDDDKKNDDKKKELVNKKLKLVNLLNLANSLILVINDEIKYYNLRNPNEGYFSKLPDLGLIETFCTSEKDISEELTNSLSNDIKKKPLSVIVDQPEFTMRHYFTKDMTRQNATTFFKSPAQTKGKSTLVILFDKIRALVSNFFGAKGELDKSNQASASITDTPGTKLDEDRNPFSVYNSGLTMYGSVNSGGCHSKSPRCEMSKTELKNEIEAAIDELGGRIGCSAAA
ncbi:MAG: hypothetical protein AAGG80_04205, partial [Pseudomonadota bacterium]